MQCALCNNDVDLDDPNLYREVKSWVHGPKLDHPTLREQTGRVAHADCIRKLKAGVPPDAEPLFEDVEGESEEEFRGDASNPYPHWDRR